MPSQNTKSETFSRLLSSTKLKRLTGVPKPPEQQDPRPARKAKSSTGS